MKGTTHMTISAPEAITTAHELIGTTPIGNWTDDPCYYVDVVDYFKADGRPNKFGLLAGPFRTLAEAEAARDKARDIATGGKYDAGAHWYLYGTCKMPNGHRQGLLNRELEL